MNDIVLVQWFPIEKRIGRYAWCNRKDDNFFLRFKEEVHAADQDHNSIVFVLESNDEAGIIYTSGQMEDRINNYFSTLYRRID